MRQLLAATALTCGAALGCVHIDSAPLDMPPSLPEPTRDCTIGVGRIADTEGADLGFDARDYLKDHGPCKKVISAKGADDPRADYVVRGTGGGRWMDDPNDPLAWTGGMGIGLGGIGLLGAGLTALLAGLPAYDSNNNPIPNSQTNPGLFQAMTPVAEVSLGVIAAGAILLLVDAAQVHSHGFVNGNFAVTQHGQPLTSMSMINSTNVVTGKGGSTDEAHARQYSLLMEPIYANLAFHLDETVKAHPPTPAPAPAPVAAPVPAKGGPPPPKTPAPPTPDPLDKP
jgi:hypothetical protein